MNMTIISGRRKIYHRRMLRGQLSHPLANEGGVILQPNIRLGCRQSGLCSQHHHKISWGDVALVAI